MPIFVGGDTQSFYYDMQFKVANSVAENTNKIYYQDVGLSSLPNPSTGWTEITTQSDIDKLKSQDNNILTYSTTTSGKTRAIMMAIDLTTVCNTLYGSSNSALIAALKAIQVDVWASGSGSSNGATANGVSVYVWDTSSSTWVTNNYVNTQSTIQQISATLSNITTKVDSTNKIYVLVVSQYPSDGTIASTLNLDYIRVRVDLVRSVDIVSPIPIYTSNIWTILIRGFSPRWDNTTTKDGRRIFKLTNGTYYIEFYYDAVNDRFVLDRKNTDGTNSTLYSNSNEVFTNWQIINFLIEQTPTGLRFRLLKNNATVEIYTLNDNKPLSGNMNLYLLSSDTQGYEADAFIDSFVFIPNQNYDDDTVAEDILRGNVTGLALGFDFAELIQSNDFSDATKWTLSGSASISNKTLTLPNVQDTAQQDINVLPNNKYHIDLKTQTKQGVAEIKEYYNNLYIRSTLLGAGLNDFITTPNTNKIRVLLKNQLQGFTRNSFAYLSDGTQVAANIPRLETGQFGQAIMIEEGTTNTIRVYGNANPQFTDLTGWSYDSLKGKASIISSSEAIYGGSVLLYQDTDGNTSTNTWDGVTVSNGNPTGNISPGGTITMTMRYKTSNVKTGFVAVWIHWYGYDSNNNLVYDVVADWVIGASNDVWVTKTTTMTTPSSSSYPNATYWRWSSFKIGFNLTNLGAQIYVDYVQIEAKPYATSFIDGARAAETLTIPTPGVLNPQEYTVEMWIRPSRARGAYLNYEHVIEFYGTSGFSGVWLNNPSNSDGIAFVKNNKVKVVANAYWNPDDWIFVAVSQRNSGMHLWVGVAGTQLIHVSNTDTTPFNAEVTKILLGSNINGTQSLNGLIDNLRISNRARTDEEILAAYQSGQPLPVDSNTTLKLDFDELGNAIFNNVSLKLKM